MSTRLKREAAKKHGLTVRAASCLVLMMINDRGERFDLACRHLSLEEVFGLMRFFPAPRAEVILDGERSPVESVTVTLKPTEEQLEAVRRGFRQETSLGLVPRAGTFRVDAELDTSSSQRPRWTSIVEDEDWPSWIRDGTWECYCGEPRAIAADREGDEWRIWCECGALTTIGPDQAWLMEDEEKS